MAIDITDNKIDKKEISSNIKVEYFILRFYMFWYGAF